MLALILMFSHFGIARRKFRSTPASSAEVLGAFARNRRVENHGEFHPLMSELLRSAACSVLKIGAAVVNDRRSRTTRSSRLQSQYCDNPTTRSPTSRASFNSCVTAINVCTARMPAHLVTTSSCSESSSCANPRVWIHQARRVRQQNDFRLQSAPGPGQRWRMPPDISCG